MSTGPDLAADPAVPRGGSPWIEVLFAAALVAVLGAQVLLPPVSGLADNGDFHRPLDAAGLSYPPELPRQDRYTRFIHHEFLRGPPRFSSFHSSTSLLLRAALMLDRLRPAARDPARPTFDLRAMGAVQAAGLLLGLLLFVWSTRRWPAALRIALCALLGLVYCDAGYTLYLNSFYSEAASLIFLSLLLGTAAAAASITHRPGRSSHPRDVLWWGPALLCALLFVYAKPQNAPLALPLAVAGWPALRPLLPDRRGWALSIGAAALLLLTAAWCFRANSWEGRLNRYNVLFYEVLRTSPSPEQDLRELGLPPEYARLRGTLAWSPGSPIADPVFVARINRVGHGGVLRFWARHPARFYDLLRRGAAGAFRLRLRYLGNYEPQSGLPPLAQREWPGAWSRLGARIFPRSLPFLGAFLLINAALALAGLRPSRRGPAPGPTTRPLAAVQALLVAIAAIQYVVALAGDGEADLAKHLFLFDAAWDGCCVVLALRALDAGPRAALRAWRRRCRPASP